MGWSTLLNLDYTHVYGWILDFWWLNDILYFEIQSSHLSNFRTKQIEILVLGSLIIINNNNGGHLYTAYTALALSGLQPIITLVVHVCVHLFNYYTMADFFGHLNMLWLHNRRPTTQLFFMRYVFICNFAELCRVLTWDN